MTEDNNKISLKKIVGSIKKNVYEKEFDIRGIKEPANNIFLIIVYILVFIVIINFLAK